MLFMRRKILVAGAVFGLALGSALAAEATTVFSYSGAEVVWSAPVAGLYDITAFGAQGGQDYRTPGALGAEIGGNLTLGAGEELIILVGGHGGPGEPELSAAGGGGGSFVVAQATAMPLVVAGGGGGGAYDNYAALSPTPGQAGPDGSSKDSGVPIASGGAGGPSPSDGGGGGGGVYGDGSQNLNFGTGSPGTGFQNGGAGGLGVVVDGIDNVGQPYVAIGGDGGFGGGGGGGIEGGGAGGGYSGGSGGRGGVGGGGGGSYFAGTPLIDLAGVNSGDGQVEIELVQATASAAPESATWALLICGAALVGGALRRHRRGAAVLSN